MPSPFRCHQPPPHYPPETVALICLPHAGLPLKLDISTDQDRLERQCAKLTRLFANLHLSRVARFTVDSANRFVPDPPFPDQAYIGTLRQDHSLAPDEVILFAHDDRWLLTFRPNHLDLPVPKHALFVARRKEDGSPDFSRLPIRSAQRLPPAVETDIDPQLVRAIGSISPPQRCRTFAHGPTP